MSAVEESAAVNLPVRELLKVALSQNEGHLSAQGALVVNTGSHTGRSPKDRFIVKDHITQDTVDWGEVNQPFSPADFQQLWREAEEELTSQQYFVRHCRVGADAHYYLPLTVKTRLAWHNIFAAHLFIDAPDAGHGFTAPWTLIDLPDYRVDAKRYPTRTGALVVLNFSERKILIVGTDYAGEMKKAAFSVMNYLLPAEGVLSMHCSAVVDDNGESALLFGLSGTGKTTLSADPARALLGDDEHGLSKDRLFNLEGGCYAKCIQLREDKEPMIFNAIRDGAVLENVVMDMHTREVDFDDARYTQNTRAAYPRSHIQGCVASNVAKRPGVILFLTCDLYGVLPAIAKLTPDQAAFYFLSGYTALVGSTEVGAGAAIRPVFSPCFGAPFFPRHPNVYANLLRDYLMEHGAHVYLVNTGWQGGPYGEGGERFPIPVTRLVVQAALSGAIETVPMEQLEGFDLQIPVQLPGLEAVPLHPKVAWKSNASYETIRDQLLEAFAQNFKRYSCHD